MTYSKDIILWALAGQQFEGWNPPSFKNLWRGSASYRNNNPGNLKKGEYTDNLGATGISPAGFLIFPDYVTGFFALCQFLTNACQGTYPLYDKTKGLSGFYECYAPTSDGNYPRQYADFVANYIHISPDYPIENLLA